MWPFVFVWVSWVSEWASECAGGGGGGGHNTDYSFSPMTFKLHMQIVDDEKKNPFNIQTWMIIDYSFSPITFKLHMQIVDDEKKNPNTCNI